ncbi:MAG TPA: manganese transporter [Rhodospirillaceae bacterium]|nr:manganese transporter [Rhodospirillaceae bacterium]
MKKIFIAVAGLIFLVSIGSAFLLRPQPEEKIGGRPYIVVTTAQIGDILTNVGGDKVRVDVLMGSGVDPHLYRPTRSDVVKLERADVVFYNGSHLEGQMVEMLEKLASEKPAVSISDGLPQDSLLGLPCNERHDPHIWMDVKKWIAAADIVKNALGAKYPEHIEFFAENAVVYKEALKELDAHVREGIKSIPGENRVLLTAHDAFGYLGAAYNIEVIGIQGISTESEAGLRKIEELVNKIVERKIPAVFVESSVSDRNIKALIEGAAAQGHIVEVGGELYSDAMGKAGTYEGTYIGMMDHNVKTIAAALGGDAGSFKKGR